MDDTELEFANYDFLLLFLLKYVTFSSETIKFCTSQFSCFIRDDPLKGQNKGANLGRERTVTRWKSLTRSAAIITCQIWLCWKNSRQSTDTLAECGLNTWSIKVVQEFAGIATTESFALISRTASRLYRGMSGKITMIWQTTPAIHRNTQIFTNGGKIPLHASLRMPQKARYGLYTTRRQFRAAPHNC